MYIRAFELIAPHLHSDYPLITDRFLNSIYNLSQNEHCERDYCLSSCNVLSSKCVLVGDFISNQDPWKLKMRRLMLLLHSFAHYVLEAEGSSIREMEEIESGEQSFRKELERDFPISAEGQAGNSVHKALFGTQIHQSSLSAAEFSSI